MSYALPISIVLTVVFATTAAGYLGFVFRPGNTAVDRVSDALHVLMSVVMLAMPWSWGMTIAPPLLQIIIFGLGTVFYLVLTVRGSRCGGHRHHGPGGSGRPILGYHVVMMAAMVIMAVMMLPMASGASMEMPDMQMSAESMTHTTGTGGDWNIICWLLVAVFTLATIWMVLRLSAAVRVRQDPLARVDGALLLLMSVGMAFAFIPGS